MITIQPLSLDKFLIFLPLSAFVMNRLTATPKGRVKSGRGGTKGTLSCFVISFSFR